MTNLKKWVGGALAVGIALGLLFLLTQRGSDTPAETVSRSGSAAVSKPGQLSGPVAQNGASLGLDSPWFDPAGAGSAAAGPSPLSTMSPPSFTADSSGKLVLNSDTHANLEKLLLQDDPNAMQAALAQATAGLPPQAAAQLKVLVNQFQQYSKALSHSISPENAPETEQDGIKLIDSLHTLRVSYLGAETAQAMFGEEEATTRQIIALMAADKEPGLTQQQKAERAQELISKKRPPAS